VGGGHNVPQLCLFQPVACAFIPCICPARVRKKCLDELSKHQAVLDFAEEQTGLVSTTLRGKAHEKELDKLAIAEAISQVRQNVFRLLPLLLLLLLLIPPPPSLLLLLLLLLLNHAVHIAATASFASAVCHYSACTPNAAGAVAAYG